MKENVDKLLEEIAMLVIQRPGPRKMQNVKRNIQESKRIFYSRR
jgi:hypothetical protein